MKNLKYLALAIAASLFVSCDDEDGFYNEKYIDTAGLVNVSVQPAYNVGDFIYVQADFSRYLNQDGFDSLLDVYQSTNGAAGYVFSYTLEKEGPAGVWTSVNATLNEAIIIDGSLQTGSFVLATAIYDASDESYEYNVGLPLASAGNYRISFGVNSESTSEIELRSKTIGNNLFLNLISDSNQLNGAGFYNFTVN